MNTTKSEVEEFLRAAHELLAKDQIVFVPRPENVQGLKDLGWTAEQAWSMIARLTPNNYYRGPNDDRDRPGTMWEFGGTAEKRATYIKLKIDEEKDGTLLKCVSFHPALFPLTYPLRP